MVTVMMIMIMMVVATAIAMAILVPSPHPHQEGNNYFQRAEDDALHSRNWFQEPTWVHTDRSLGLVSSACTIRIAESHKSRYNLSLNLTGSRWIARASSLRDRGKKTVPLRCQVVLVRLGHLLVNKGCLL